MTGPVITDREVIALLAEANKRDMRLTPRTDEDTAASMALWIVDLRTAGVTYEFARARVQAYYEQLATPRWPINVGVIVAEWKARVSASHVPPEDYYHCGIPDCQCRHADGDGYSHDSPGILEYSDGRRVWCEVCWEARNLRRTAKGLDPLPVGVLRS